MNARKLSPDDIVDIRELYESGDFRMIDLAEMYGVCLRTISDVINGVGYKDITKGIAVHLPGGHKRIYTRGEIGPRVLNGDQVVEMRRNYSILRARGNSATAIFGAFSKQYGVSIHTVVAVIYSHTWKHLPSVKELRKLKENKNV